jgi:hypothetical protein
LAESKGKIQDLSAPAVEVDGADGKMEVAPGVVQSVTTTVPHEADASSAPGPYTDLDVNRPPVSTNRPDVPIAHSLVAGAGAPTGEPEYHPEYGQPGGGQQEPDYGAAAAAESAAKAESSKK